MPGTLQKLRQAQKSLLSSSAAQPSSQALLTKPVGAVGAHCCLLNLVRLTTGQKEQFEQRDAGYPNEHHLNEQTHRVFCQTLWSGAGVNNWYHAVIC